MRRPAHLSAFVFILASMLTGCFGYVSVMPDICEKETPSTHARIVDEEPNLPSARLIKADFLRVWGEPDRIENPSATTEIWTYKRKLWCGGVAAFFISVPLLLPVCDGYEIIEFRDTVATSLRIRRTIERGFLFGIGGLYYANDPACRYPVSDENGEGRNIEQVLAPANMAIVYYYRTGPYQAGLDRHNRVYIDGECSGENMGPSEFYIFKILPGPHIFESRKSKLTLNAAGGQTYFIHEEGIYHSVHVEMSLVDEVVGRQHIGHATPINLDETRPCGTTMRPSGTDLKNAAAPEGKAIMYLYCRDNDGDELHSAFVRLNGGANREIEAGTFLTWQLSPGMHILESSSDKVSLDVRAGEKYYVRLDAVAGLLGRWRHPLQPVKQEEGRREVGPLLLMEGEDGIGH